MKYHGGAPRVRRKHNSQTGAESDSGKEIVINEELIINKVLDAVITTGVAYILTRRQ